MPTSSGPNTLGESNLVFAYDIGDMENSYKGQPTTNLEASNINTTFESLSDGDAAGFNNQLGSGNYLGVTSTIGYKSSKSLRVNRGTGGTGRIYKTYSVSAGDYSTVSAWVYSTVAGPFLALEYFGGDYSWGVSYTNNTHTGKGWERLFVRTNGSATSNTTAYYFLYTSVENTNIFLDNIQTEKKQYPTTFVNGTRSATQGLLPLVGTSSIDLTNVSFNSNAQMIFDGTNDYVDCGAIQPFDLSARNVTWEAVVKFNNTSGAEAIMTRWNNSTGEVWWFGRYDTTKIHVAFIIGGGYYGYYSDGNIGTSAGYYHVAVTLNNTVLSYYINGVLDSTDTVAAGTWTSDPDPNLLIGAQNQGAASNLNGEIPVAKIYNRVLTAQEVKQNYQQYKTRFNLS